MNKEMPSSQTALEYKEHGDPSEVLSLVELPVPKPGPGEVLIEMQASPIHPSDIGLIMGSYGRPRNPPAIAGREGVDSGQMGEGGQGDEPPSRSPRGSWSVAGIPTGQGQ